MTQHGGRTEFEPPLWLRCDACAALEDLVLENVAEGPILCKRCTERRSTGPSVNVRVYAPRGAGVEQEITARLRRVLGELDSAILSVTARLDQPGAVTGFTRARVYARLFDGATLAVECGGIDLNAAVDRAMSRLCQAVARHEARHETVERRGSGG